MTRTRLSAADRRTDILAGARRAYARHGLNASSQQLAAEAGVSEALVFRHFGSKLGLYKAVLRDLIEDQNAAYEAMGLTGTGAQGLTAMLTTYFRACLEGRQATHAERIRIIFANLAAEGDFARMTYRRAVRLGMQPLQTALDQARADGDLTGLPISPSNVIMLLEHIGSMITLASGPGQPIGSYDGSHDERLRQLIWFAGRGIGLSEDALIAHTPAALLTESEDTPD
ncbi:MAG: TetR/AcrR family transcriptional regulator [Candidatus Brevundimonas phytovorans]|nr:TetR/AcrR family transcriptional regulator [Brevundimonas sp.]WEK56745.1 MAG: TetR/AcrR family transcriptional regulator [Brevundimonas sp.]